MAAIRMIERLVAFPTVSADSNLQMIEFVRGELARNDIESRLIYTLCTGRQTR